jgi:hypothetical protein
MKIVGIVLLVLLCLVLLVLLFALFVPFTYRLRGSCHDRKLHADGHVFAFAGLLGAGGEFRDQELGVYLRILGIKKRLGGDAAEKQARVKPQPKSPKKDTAQEAQLAQEPEPGQAKEALSGAEPEESAANKAERFAGMREKLAGFGQRVSGLWKKVTGVTAAAEENREAIRFLLGQLAWLLRGLSPRKCRLSLTFSTGSPDTTGQVLGVLALFPFVYRNRWQVTPDFVAEDFYVETDFDIRGHIFGIQILVIAVRILLDKNCQRLYHKLI